MRVPIQRTDCAADPVLEEGKRRNVVRAAREIDNSWIQANRPFSFWRTVGALTESRGYRAGLEIHGGCLVPSIGGGVCLLTNALFEAVAHAGWVVLERHGHSQEAVPHDGPIWGLDATVLYPFVDLRFAPLQGSGRIRARVVDGDLEVSLYGTHRHHVELHATDDHRVGDRRKNRVIRRYRTEDGTLLRAETVAKSERRILHAEEQRRTCRTCDEQGCPSRARFLSLATA